MNMAIAVLRAIIEKGETHLIKRYYNSLPSKAKRNIVKSLELADEEEILVILGSE